MNTDIINKLCTRADTELLANSHKGPWDKWNPSPKD